MTSITALHQYIACYSHSVGTIVLLATAAKGEHDDDNDDDGGGDGCYYNGAMDDLGCVYLNGARAE